MPKPQGWLELEPCWACDLCHKSLGMSGPRNVGGVFGCVLGWWIVHVRIFQPAFVPMDCQGLSTHQSSAGFLKSVALCSPVDS